MVIPIFPAELHPSAESVFDSPEIIQTTQLFLQLVVCFNSPKPFPMWLRDSSPLSKTIPPFIWGYQVIQVDHDLLVGGAISPS